jgi:hypothetical protein
MNTRMKSCPPGHLTHLRRSKFPQREKGSLSGDDDFLLDDLGDMNPEDLGLPVHEVRRRSSQTKRPPIPEDD